jgi:peptidoglycan/xylan/chitin deacetylase (PgdA/CDA1 family)
MKMNGYHPVSFSDVAEKRPLPAKPVLITFDDGYQNNADLAVPLLNKYGYPAIFFISTAYIGKTNEWDRGSDQIMDAETLKKLASSGPFEIGLHSHRHINYETSPIETVEDDIKTSVNTLKNHAVPFLPVLAYPYGKYPRKEKMLNQKFQGMLKETGITYAFRIGSKKNRLPIRAPYDITRTNIKGSESFFIFKIKLKKGRAKLFK